MTKHKKHIYISDGIGLQNISVTKNIDPKPNTLMPILLLFGIVIILNLFIILK